MRRPIKYIFFLLLLAVVVSAQPPQISIIDFKGGLVTNHSRFSLKPNQARECLNWDLSVEIGALVKRKGYLKLTDTLLFDEPNIGLYGYTARSGSRRLFGVVGLSSDSTFLGLGEIRASAEYSYALNTTSLIPDDSNFYRRYFYAGATPWFTNWRNDVVISNGRQSPMIWRDGLIRDLVPISPGGLNITPMKIPVDSGNGLSDDIEGSPYGEYRYVLGYKTLCGSEWSADTNYSLGVVSAPVKLDHEKAMITDFIWHTIDSTCLSADGDYTDADLAIFRTRANPDYFDETDTLWRVWTETATAVASVDTLWAIDSLADTALGSSINSFLIPNFDFGMIDSAGVYTDIRPGAPTYIDHVTTGRTVMPDTGLVWATRNYIGYAYAITFRDSLTGSESDTGRTLNIFFKSTHHGYKIGIPPLPGNMRHLDRILYRAPIFDAPDSIGGGYDTTYTVFCLKEWCPPHQILIPGGKLQDCICLEEDTVYIHTRRNAWDTVISGPMKRIAVFDTLYTDSVWFDTTTFTVMERNEPFDGNTNRFLNGLSAFDDRLWGYEGSVIYWSRLGEGFIWDYFSGLALNLDDGDEITAIVPSRNHIAVYKNNAKFIVISDGDTSYIRSWTIQGVGCVAPRSMVSYKNGRVYLSGDGVIYERGSLYLSQGASFDTISTAIDNLLQYKASELAGASGIIMEDKYMLSFPDKDTTYVYDFVVGSWGIWSYAFEQTTFYDTVKSLALTPSNDMLFIDGESDLVFKADTTYLDNGSKIGFSWKSGAITKNPEQHSISKYGLWAKGEGVGAAEFLRFEIIDVRDSVIDTNVIRLLTDTSLYHIYNTKPHKSNSFSFRMRDHSGLKPDTLIIWGIDFWVKMQGKTIIE